jgi:hypothetical protein
VGYLGAAAAFPPLGYNMTGGGVLVGPAPTARQVRAVTVQVTQMERGVWRVTQAMTPGWAGLARTPAELARVVEQAFAEAQIAAHARWRNTPYETVDTPPHRRSPRPARAGHRRDVHDPRGWRITPEGKWVAPGSGRLWRPDSQAVARVRHRRMQLGLNPEPELLGTERELS